MSSDDLALAVLGLNPCRRWLDAPRRACTTGRPRPTGGRHTWGVTLPNRTRVTGRLLLTFPVEGVLTTTFWQSLWTPIDHHTPGRRLFSAFPVADVLLKLSPGGLPGHVECVGDVGSD